MRNLLCFFWENHRMFSCSLFGNRKKPFVPECSQVSKESRWELVQRSRNIQMRTSVQKSGCKEKWCKHQVANERNGRAGGVRNKADHAVRPLCISSLSMSPMKSPRINTNRRRMPQTEKQQNSSFKMIKYFYYIHFEIFPLNYTVKALQLALQVLKKSMGDTTP